MLACKIARILSCVPIHKLQTKVSAQCNVPYYDRNRINTSIKYFLYELVSMPTGPFHHRPKPSRGMTEQTANYRQQYFAGACTLRTCHANVAETVTITVILREKQYCTNKKDMWKNNL